MLRFQQIDNQNDRRVREACTAESVTWTNSRWHFRGRMVTKGGSLLHKASKTGQSILRSIGVQAAEHPHNKYYVANPTD